MIARQASEADIRHVFRLVPAARAFELTATAFHDDVGILAEELILVRTPDLLFALVPGDGTQAGAGRQALPWAIVGVLPFGSGIAGMIWASTANWPRIALSSHRWWRREFVPNVLGRYRRVEFSALASDTDSRRWLHGLGFTEEGVAYRQGKRGEDFVHFAWLNPDRTAGLHVQHR